MRIKCSSKDEWDIAMKKVYDQEIECIEVEIDDRHQMHNLIYYVILKSHNPRLGLHIFLNDKDFNDGVPFEILTLFENYYYKNEIIFYANNEKKEFFLSKKANYDATLPILEFGQDYKELGEIDEDLIETLINDGTIIETKKNSINFLKKMILINYKTVIDKNLKFKDEINNILFELNLLPLFLLLYQLIDEKIENVVKLNDLKNEIRSLCIGMYQIIENSVIHSQGKKSYVFFSKLKMYKTEKFRKIQTYKDNVSNMYIKRLSFMKNYDFQLDSKEYIFIRLIDDIKDKKAVDQYKNIVDSIGKENLNENYFANCEDDEILMNIFSALLQGNCDLFNYNNDVDVISKYGLITFLNSAKNLKMQFLCNSRKQQFLFTDYEFQKDTYIYRNECPINTFVTEYSCVYPISGTIKNDLTLSQKIEYQLYYEEEPIDTVKIDLSDFESNNEKVNVTSKSELVRKIYSFIKNKEKYIEDDKNKIIYIDIKDCNDIEIIVKVISNYFYIAIKDKKKSFIVINFIDEVKNRLFTKLSEFLQYLKVCNIKLNKLIEEKDFEYDHNNFQISFFHTLNNEKNFISTMVGINWGLMVSTFINNLLYENDLFNMKNFNTYINESDLRIDEKIKEVKVLPFEYYIETNLSENRLYNKIQKILSSNPILHNDSNILLGSGLYLNKFYEAEHIFHNKYLMLKIALIIKNDIFKIKNVRKYKKIVIVGYENYSHILCEELKKIIANFDSEIIYVPHLNTQKKYDINIDETLFISILPIGSTLFTFYKMNMFIRKILKIKENKYLFKKNYCIVTVAPLAENEFWFEKNKNQNFRIIQFKNDSNIIVNSMISLDTDWKKSAGEQIALTYVDKSSTLPLTIYASENSKLEKNKKIKDFEKLKNLKGCVNYGHYVLDDNHYLFYINHTLLLEKAKKAITDDLVNKTKDINMLAYNIIVSPLTNHNSFLNVVVDSVFSGNASIIQYDPFSTLRENFINKYKFIIENIKKILKTSSTAKINIYFADNTIISGKTIQRGKELIKALFDEDEDIKNSNKFSDSIFQNVFILIKRCSDNTIKSLIGNKEKLYSYIELMCPSFDTHGNVCPDCKIAKNYDYLAEMSYDNELANKFREFSQKHQLIDVKKCSSFIPKNDAFFRLCATNYILLYKKELFEIYDNYMKNKDDTECHKKLLKFKEKMGQVFAKEIKENVDNDELNIIFAKIISRPFISMYEKLKQVAFVYLKKEFNLEIEKNESEIKKEYIKLLIDRISYFGSTFLNNNEEKLNNLESKKVIEKCELKKAIVFEKALSRGVIR